MPTTYYEIPLSGVAQKFSISLGGVPYQMLLAWRDVDQGGWFLDIADSNAAPIVQGIPLITGADLLAQYTDKGFGGQLLVATDGDADLVPTYANLGGQSHLYFAVVS